MKISKSGYKKNSKDKNEPALVIPSNNITMKDVDFPVYGVDDTGYSQIMYPGMDYMFPGNYVYELPIAQDGGYILPGRYRNPEGNWVSKYASGGDISIPDLSNKGWLSKYQTGGVHQKIYTDPLEFEEANRAYNDSLVLHDNTKNMINDLVYLDNIYKNNPNILADKWLDYSIEWYKSKGPKVDLPYNRLTQKNKKAPEPSKTYKSKVDPNQVAVEYKKPTEKPVLQKKPSTLEDIYRITKRFENMELPNGFQSDYDSGKSNLGFTKEEQDIIYGLPEHILKKVIVPHNNGEYFTFPQPNYQELKSIDLSSREPQLHTSSNNITNTKFKTKPIMRSAQDTKTGQYQIGYNYWDDKSKSWKQKMFSKETQQENYDDVKIPRKKTIKVPPQFQNGGWLQKYQYAGSVSSKYDLMKVDQPTAVASSTNVVVPNIVNVPKKVAAIKPEVPKYNKIPTKSKKESYPPKNYSKISSRPGVSGSMVTVFVDPKTGEEWISPEQQAAQQEYNELSRSNNIDRIGTTILAGSVAAPLLRPALSYLNAPAVLPYFGEVPWLTANNVIGAAGATDAIVNRFPEIPGQLLRGEYMDAAINAGTGTLDLFGANMVSPFKGGKYTFSTPEQLPVSANTSIPKRSVIYPEPSKPLPDYMEPYLGKVKQPVSLREEVFRTFLTPQTQAELEATDWIHYDREGNIISKLNDYPIETLQQLPGSANVDAVTNTAKKQVVQPKIKASEYLANYQLAKDLQTKELLKKSVDPKLLARYPNLLDNVTKAALKKYNTTYRVVTPDVTNATLDELTAMYEAGVTDFFDSDQVARYMSTHVPLRQIGYRANPVQPGYMQDLLYTGKYSNAEEAAKDLSRYGTHLTQLRPQMDFSTGTKQDWIKKYYDELPFALGDKYDETFGYKNTDLLDNITDQIGDFHWKEGTIGARREHEYWPYIGTKGSKVLEAVRTKKIKKHGGWLHKYQDGGVKSQVEPDGRKMAENLKRIWNLSQPSFTRPSSYDEYTPKFGWSRGSMTPEERAYEQEYLRQKYSPIPYLYIDPYELQTIDYLQNLLFSKPKKKGGVKSSGEGYYDYINGYSGIFAKGGNVSKENNWLNKYK